MRLMRQDCVHVLKFHKRPLLFRQVKSLQDRLGHERANHLQYVHRLVKFVLTSSEQLAPLSLPRTKLWYESVQAKETLLEFYRVHKFCRTRGRQRSLQLSCRFWLPSVQLRNQVCGQKGLIEHPKNRCKSNDENVSETADVSEHHKQIVNDSLLLRDARGESESEAIHIHS